MKKLLSVILAVVLVFGFSCAYAEGETKTVTDMLGRTVEVPTEVNKVVCIGAGALRLYSYIGDLDKLCGVEACEYGFLISVRPYQMVNEELFKSLPSVGAGGPQGSPDAEAILAAQPDVIISLYTSDISAMDLLEEQTGIPVVVLSYGKTEAFDNAIINSISILGEVLNRQERAKEVTDIILGISEDLNNRTKDVPDDEKKTVYLGCQSNYGTHGMGSSTGNYSLFNAVNAKNVLDLNGYEGYQKALDLETILTLDPEVIILDAGGLEILREEYGENKAVFDSLSAFMSGEVYLQMPYNAYYTNLEIAYSDAYFIGTVLYPSEFSDIDITEKFGEISVSLLGVNCYEEIAEAMYGGYQKLNIEEVLN